MDLSSHHSLILTANYSDSTDIATIQNPGGSQFTVHAAILAHYSSYFRRALNSSFVAGETCIIRLDKRIDDDALKLFMDWLYMASSGQRVEDNDYFRFCYGYSAYIAAWILGDSIQAPSFQNDMMRCILIRGDSLPLRLYITNVKLPGEDGLQFPWETIPTDSALEAFLLDVVCSYLLVVQQNVMEERLNELPLNIAAKLSLLLLRRLPEPKVDEADSSVSKGDEVN
jgi:hypothetical protein